MTPRPLTAGLSTLTWLQFLTSLVDWMLLVFLQIMVFQLTGSAFNIMLLVLCELIPMLLIGAWAGAIVDRAKLNRVLFWSCAARWLASIALLAPTVRQTLGALYVVAAFGAACNRFFSPAASAMLPRMTSAATLPRANALIMGVRMAGMAVGTVLAGGMASRYGLDLVAVLIGILLLIAGACCLLLPAIAHHPSSDHAGGILSDLREAVTRFGSVLLMPVAASVLVTLALGSFEILALIYVSQVLDRPPNDVGLLFGAYGLGMLGGLLLSSWRGAMPRYGQIMLASLSLMCLSTWTLAQIDVLALALAMAAMAGIAEGLVLSLSLLRLYTSVPMVFCARMVALLDTATAASFLLAVLATGAVADNVPANVLLEYMAWIFACLLLLGVAVTGISAQRHASRLSATEEADDA